MFLIWKKKNVFNIFLDEMLFILQQQHKYYKTDKTDNCSEVSVWHIPRHLYQSP